MSAVATCEAKSRTYALTGIRRMVAQKMVRSLAEAAQLTFHGEADITRLQTWRRDQAAAGRRISLEDVVLWAYVRALAEQPLFNSTLDGDSVTEHSSVALAVAITSTSGLVTPVIRGAERLDLDGIAAARSDLVDRAKVGGISVAEMKGASSTLSNLGRSRVRFFTPILNHPQVAILGVGMIGEGLGLTADGTVEARQSLGLSLTVDHRLIDGAPAAAFLGTVCARLEGVAHGDV
ncbi:MAG: 2-oxo acid dehydrogenase subunit E2 [Sphingomonadales bacterium]|nr:2-oxo acid dehydrogenase subunit E2 [Sphingomonadales bacterium]